MPSRFASLSIFALMLLSLSGCGDDDTARASEPSGDGDGDQPGDGDGDGDGDDPGDGDGDTCVPDDSICPGWTRCRAGEPCWHSAELPEGACDDAGASDEDAGASACAAPTCDEVCGALVGPERCVENGCEGSTWSYGYENFDEEGYKVPGRCDEPIPLDDIPSYATGGPVECCCE